MIGEEEIGEVVVCVGPAHTSICDLFCFAETAYISYMSNQTQKAKYRAISTVDRFQVEPNF